MGCHTPYIEANVVLYAHQPEHTLYCYAAATATATAVELMLTAVPIYE